MEAVEQKRLKLKRSGWILDSLFVYTGDVMDVQMFLFLSLHIKLFLCSNSIFICNLNSWLDVSSAVSFISVNYKKENLDYDENVTGLFMALALFEMLAHRYFNPQGCGAGVEKLLCVSVSYQFFQHPPPPYYGKQ